MFHFLSMACFFSISSLFLSFRFPSFSHSFLLGLSSLFLRRRRSLLYAPRPDSRFVFESTSCRARLKEEEKGGRRREKKSDVSRCASVRLYLWLVRGQPGYAWGSCPKVQKIVPDCRSARPCVSIYVYTYVARVQMYAREFLFRVHRM